MAKVEFDFEHIQDVPAFYRDFARKFALDEGSAPTSTRCGTW